MKQGNVRRTMRLETRQKPRFTFRQLAVASSAFFFLLVAGVFIYFNFSNTKQAFAAATGNFRSITNGSWNNIATWEKFNGSAWMPATATPSLTDGVITIQKGHTVIVTAGVVVDQVIVDAGGTLSVTAGTLSVANGAGTDITVNGTLNISGTVTLALLSNIDVNSLAVLKPGGTINFLASGFINVNGRFRRTGGTMPIASTCWIINNGGTFEHAINGGNLLPSACWKAGSTCEVTGITTTMPGNINMTFHHFTWNCPGQLSGFDFIARLNFVNGNLTIISTGVSALQFDYQGNNNTTNIGGNLTIQGGTSYGCANGSAVFYIGGNYVQSGGTFAFNQSRADSYENTSTTLNIAGNLIMTGGTMDMTQSTASNVNIVKGHINLVGNISLSGTALLTETSADSRGEIVFTGTAVQTYDLNNLVTNKIDYIVNTGSTVRTNLNLLTGSGNFTLMSAGHLMIGSPDGITSTNLLGNVQVTGSRTYSTEGYYTYEGTSGQVSGDGLPSQVANLTLNNASNCTLTGSTSVSGILTFASGLWIATTDTLTLGISPETCGTLSRMTGHVVGYFRRWLTTVTVNDILFPVGTLNNYNGANFSFTTAPTSGGSIVSTFIPRNPGKSGLPKMDDDYKCEGIGYAYWSFGAFNSFEGGAYTVNLYANGFSGITDYTSMHICRKNAARVPWSFNGTHTPGTGSNEAPVANRLDVTILGNYGITSGGPDPLPVKALRFKALQQNNTIKLTWTPAAEINNDYFILERSADATDFSEITKINASGTSGNMHAYSYIDEYPLSGKSYYRLTQTDLNGKSKTFKIVAVTLQNNTIAQTELSISPNPFSDSFIAEFNALAGTEILVTISNMNGVIVYSEKATTVEGTNIYRFVPDDDFKEGTYVFRLSANKTLLASKKIICRKI